MTHRPEGKRTTLVLMNEATPYRRKQGGVFRYLARIARAAAGHYGARLAVCSAWRIAPAPSRWIPTPRFRGSGRLHMQDLVTSCAAAALRPRLYYGGYYGNVRTSAPQAFTVYDLIHELYYPSTESMVRRALDEKRRCFDRAASLIAISHSTARDILRLYPHIDQGKIVVTHLGVDEIFFQTPEAHQGRPYFLFVGIRARTKNFSRLVDAFAMAGLARDFDLVVVSPGIPFTGEEDEHLRARGLKSSVRLITTANDEELARFYAQAAALVYPSEYEGFGLPILEAMAAGTLVATSNTSSMPEVGGDVALYFDPRSVESIGEAMTRISGLSAIERQRREQEGIAWARTFTWERCQSQTLTVFDGLLAG